MTLLFPPNPNLISGNLTLSYTDGYPAILRISFRTRSLTIGGCLNADPTSVLALVIPDGDVYLDGVPSALRIA